MNGTRTADVRAVLTAEDHRILALLAECATDEAVARHMLMSVRTVRRRIARLLELFDVRTRFAAGVAAGSLGLVGSGTTTPPAREVRAA